MRSAYAGRTVGADDTGPTGSGRDTGGGRYGASAPAPRPGHPGHRRRAECRTSCAGSGGHVGAEPARLGEPEQRVEVGSVHIDRPPPRAPCAHSRSRLVQAVRRRVRHHDGGECVAVLPRCAGPGRRVPLPSGQHATRTRASGNHRAGRVRAVRVDGSGTRRGAPRRGRGGTADRQQAGHSPCEPRWAGPDGGRIPGHLGQPALQLATARATPVSARPVRTMDVRELGPDTGSISAVALSFTCSSPADLPRSSA